MLRHFGCSRCLGTLYEESDIYGSYFICLTCGAITDLTPQSTDQRSAELQRIGALGQRTNP